MEKAVPGKYSFYQAIREGIFTVPGDPEGGIDFEPIFDTFRKRDYEGWIVVEAEQDPGRATPSAPSSMPRWRENSSTITSGSDRRNSIYLLMLTRFSVVVDLTLARW